MKDQLISLFEYGEWVNQRLLNIAVTLTSKQFTQKVLSGFGSAHLTLVHLLGAEVLWFARWREQSPKTILSPNELPTVDSIDERWTLLIEERHAYLASLEEVQLNNTVHWTNMRGQSFALLRWQVMFHAINHSTHHRSELATILTQLGYEPDSTDLLEYYLGLGGQQWKPTSLPK